MRDVMRISTIFGYLSIGGMREDRSRDLRGNRKKTFLSISFPSDHGIKREGGKELAEGEGGGNHAR